MKKYSISELKNIVSNHYLYKEGKGERANLSETDLSALNFSRVLLSNADLSKSDLSKTNFSHSDLCIADLSNSNLKNANLFGAFLYKANLSGACLEGANLFGASLVGADFKDTIYEDNIPVIINTEYYNIIKTKRFIKIGCKNHTPEEWEKFSLEEIEEMDGQKAVAFWKKYKSFILKDIK